MSDRIPHGKVTVLYRAVIPPGYGEPVFEDFPVKRHTTEGWWITVNGKPKWTSGKFASPDKGWALDRLKDRTKAYVRISFNNLADALLKLESLGLGIPERLASDLAGSPLLEMIERKVTPSPIGADPNEYF